MRRVRVERKRRQDLLVGRARRVEAALEVFDAQHRRLDLVGERRARPVVAQRRASAGRDAAEPRREVFDVPRRRRRGRHGERIARQRAPAKERRVGCRNRRVGRRAAADDRRFGAHHELRRRRRPRVGSHAPRRSWLGV